MKKWFQKLFGKKDQKHTPLFTEVRQGDHVSLYDQQTVDYLESELPNPTQDEFLKRIGESEKIIISKNETNMDKLVKAPMTINGKTIEMEGHPVEKVKIADIHNVQEVLAYFEILDESKGHLMCVGDILFDFVDKQGNLVEVEYLGFGHIRIEALFKDDAELKRPMEFLHWLQSIGISEPLNRWIEDENRRKESDRRIVEWTSAAPKALAKRIDLVDQDPLGQADKNVLKELKAEIPDEKELVLQLFKLYGTGFHEWSGFPLYETLPANILMRVKIDFLNKIFEQKDLDKEQKEGMARFLSSWDFSQKRKSDLHKVSQKVKDMLLAHLEEMGDEDKISQFKNRLS